MSGHKLKRKTWVLVADGEKALFLRNEGDATYPNLAVVSAFREENPPNHERGSDRPGRMNDGAGNDHRSAVQEADWHRIAKQNFADEISDRLYRMAHGGEFDEIIISAPPLVLGEIRKKMHKEVADRVVAEMPKTLTGHTLPQIEKAMSEL